MAKSSKGVAPKVRQVAAATTPESLNRKAAKELITTPPIPLAAEGWFSVSQKINLEGQIKLAAITPRVTRRARLQML